LITDSGLVTTAGVIALGNLEARIDGQVSRATEGRLTVGERAELVELIALRGHVLGSIADAERAAAMADELVGQLPRDARSFLARARMRSVFHRFPSALTDLGTAAGLGGDRVELEAERWFTAATRSYRGTSPFPPAMLEFQRGKLWMEHDDLRRARAWCDAAVRRLGAYVSAQGHLAELDAALGETAAAIARLRPLALASDDPDYATQLARILGDAGQTDEARTWRDKAEARYDELLARHRDAFADHAAEFWLTIGGDPERALSLARHNLSVRQTPRARALVRRSERGVRSGPGRLRHIRPAEDTLPR
jgi:tetratricopeptide (TPR) repeat protein